MPNDPTILSETRELLDLDADQGLDPGQAARLAELLTEHPEALDLYIEYTDQAAALQKTSGQNLSIGESLVHNIEQGLDAQESHPRQPPNWKPWLAAASLALVTGILFKWNKPAAHTPTPTAITTATLARAVNAHWTLGNDPDAPAIRLKSGDKLPAGRIHLAAGMAQVTFDSGTSLVLEAPAEFEVRGDNEGFLHQGRATARVPEGAQGFVLDTPALHVVDLGTEFALSASASGMTDVMVIEGEIEVNLPSAPLDAIPIRLLENHALRADRTIGSLESIDADNLPTFRRALPSDVSLRPGATGHDWNDAANWDDHLPTSADKDYHVGGGFSQAIDTPRQGKATFQGRSLHIDLGGILRLHNSGDDAPIHIADLHLNRGTLKPIPAARTLRLDGTLTLEGNAVIDLVDNSGRILELSATLHTGPGIVPDIQIRQTPKRQRFSTPRPDGDQFEDSRVRLLRANPEFAGTWIVEGGILEAVTQGSLGSEASLQVSGMGKFDPAGQAHSVASATIGGETLEPGMHTFAALLARFPMHITGNSGTLTIRE